MKCYKSVLPYSREHANLLIILILSRDNAILIELFLFCSLFTGDPW